MEQEKKFQDLTLMEFFNAHEDLENCIYDFLKEQIDTFIRQYSVSVEQIEIILASNVEPSDPRGPLLDVKIHIKPNLRKHLM